MKGPINLATPKKVTKRALRKLNFFSIGSFLIVFIFAVFLLILTFILNTNVSSLEKKILDTKHRISLLTDKKEKTLFIKDRLSNIQKIIKNRKDIGGRISPVIDSISGNTQIDSITAQDEVMTIYVSARSLAELDSLINDKIVSYAASSKKTIRKIDIGNFGIKNGAYSASLDFYFIAKGPIVKG